MNNAILCDIGMGRTSLKICPHSRLPTSRMSGQSQKAGRDSPVVMDELGSGTDPAEGMGIAVAILEEELKEEHALFLATSLSRRVKRVCPQNRRDHQCKE